MSGATSPWHGWSGRSPPPTSAQPVDVGAIAPTLLSLEGLAGLEGWWLTAQLAGATGIEDWWRLAEDRVARLAASAGERGHAFARYAGTRLESMRTAGRRG